jgi:hypothetical protein
MTTKMPRDWGREAAGHMPSRGHWVQAKDGAIFLRCPNGHVNTIVHAIDRSGTLSPSYQCSHSGCDFHVMPMQLIDWNKP